MTTLDKIKAEIRKVLDKERDFTSENAKAQAMALMWCLEIIDRYASEECDNDCEHCAYIECPKEPCEDAVSRQAVLEIIKSHTLTDDYLAVEQLPSVQPMFTNEEIELLGQCLSRHFYMISGVPQTVLSCMEKLNKLKQESEK